MEIMMRESSADARAKPAGTETNRCTEYRLMELELENMRLQRLVAELLARNQQLRAGS